MSLEATTVGAVILVAIGLFGLLTARNLIAILVGLQLMAKGAMLGLIVNIRQRVKAAGGRLVLCGLSRQLTDIFYTSSMQRLFTIAKGRPEALKALGA